MKTKNFFLACFVLCFLMLLNIGITQSKASKLSVKINSLKEAEATQKEPVDAFNRWYMPGSGDPTTEYFGQLSCYQRYGWFELPVTCSNY